MVDGDLHRVAGPVRTLRTAQAAARPPAADLRDLLREPADRDLPGRVHPAAAEANARAGVMLMELVRQLRNTTDREASRGGMRALLVAFDRVLHGVSARRFPARLRRR